MLIATDLDGTLALGEKEDIQEIYSLFKAHNMKVVYVTGRDLTNFRSLTRSFDKDKGIKLQYPDYLIALNGVKIYMNKKGKLIPIKRLTLDKQWNKIIKNGWNKRHCLKAFKRTAQQIRFGNDLPALIDVKYKPTPFYIESIVHYKKLDAIKQLLLAECSIHNIDVNLIFDYLPQKYVDMGLKVLDKVDITKANIVRQMRDEEGGVYVMQPSATTKGAAVYYLMNKLKLTRNQVIAAGDGGNDYHLLTQGFTSIIVNNAHQLLLKEPLKNLPPEEKANLIFVPYDGARGLLEGLKICLNQPFSHSSDGSLCSVINA